MEHKGLYVSQREIRRYELLQKVVDEKLTLRQVTEALGVSYRQALRLKAKVVAEGLPGLVHGNRGRAPANQPDASLRARVLALSKERYFDFNDSHFAELLAAEEGIVLSRETIRSWRRQAGLPPKQRRRGPQHRKRRPRSEAEGLMMLWDGSPHRWFGEEHPACCLMAAIDDATGKVLAANASLEAGFLEAHTARFAPAPAFPEAVWRQAPKRARRERILSLCYRAKVSNDNAVRLDGMILDIPPGPGKRSYAHAGVEVRQLLDGRWRVYYRERVIAQAPATEIAELIRTRRRRKGVPAAYDDLHVFLASKPSAPELDLLEELRTGRPPTDIRRAGPGGVIGATRIA